MLDSKLTKFFSGCLLSILGSGFVYAEDTLRTSQNIPVQQAQKQMPQAQVQTPQQVQGQAPQPQTADPKAALTPEEIAYQSQMLGLSNVIAAKIMQIQAKQKQIDSLIYPNDLPVLQTDMIGLKKELEALNLQQQSLQAHKTASDMNALLKHKQS